MRVGIMQPYFLPYLGYFQLIDAVDTFVVYDNIQYTKKGWINRNRMLVNGKENFFTIPLKKASDYLDVRERNVSEVFESDNLLNKFYSAYHKAICFEPVYALLEDIVKFESDNLFEYIYHSLLSVIEYLEIQTKIVVSSNISIDHSLRNTDKVIALCKALNANEYINPIGGTELYSKEYFKEKQIDLAFIKPQLTHYKQLQNDFIPGLSIVDVLMFNDVNRVKSMLKEYIFE